MIVTIPSTPQRFYWLSQLMRTVTTGLESASVDTETLRPDFNNHEPSTEMKSNADFCIHHTTDNITIPGGFHRLRYPSPIIWRSNFQIVDFSRSWAVGDFRHPAGSKVPSPWTRLDLIDSRFVRFRSRSDCTEIFIKKSLKTKKLENFLKVRFFFNQKGNFLGGTLDPTTICPIF